MTSTMLNRRTLLMGLTASAGTAILAACGGTAATTAPTTAATLLPQRRDRQARRPRRQRRAAQQPPHRSNGACGDHGANDEAAAATAPPAAMATAATGATGTVTGGAYRTTAASAPAMMAAATGGMPMGPSMCATGSIVSLGSTALQPLVEAAQKVYLAKCIGAQIQVQGGGSGTGLTQVFGGQAAIGNSDIFAEDGSGIDAKQLEDHQVVAQAFGIIANPGVNITNLTQDQVISIFTGKATNYKDVGGPDQAIVVINRPASSGTRGNLQEVRPEGHERGAGQGADGRLVRRRGGSDQGHARGDRLPRARLPQARTRS